MGASWQAKGDYDKAITYCEQALGSLLKTVGADHPNVALARNNLGASWQAKGDYDKAITYYENALMALLKSLGPNHPNTMRVKKSLESAKQMEK